MAKCNNVKLTANSFEITMVAKIIRLSINGSSNIYYRNINAKSYTQQYHTTLMIADKQWVKS